jgi:hypothetical protein
MNNYYRDWFPDLPSYEGFNHRLNGLADVMPMFTQHCFDAWKELPESMATKVIVTDSFPVLTASGKRSSSHCTVISNKGRCATKGLWYRGVKVHMGGFEQSRTLPIPAYLIISPASVHDKTAQQDFLPEFINTIVVGDRAYVDQSLSQQMKENNSELITPPRFGRGTTELDHQLDSAANSLANTVVSRLRQPIETIFSWLVGHVDIERASRVRSFRGLMVHIYGKIAAVICRHKLAVTI